MTQRTHSKSVVVVLAAWLTGAPATTFSQSQNQNPNGTPPTAPAAPSTTTRPSSKTTKPNPPAPKSSGTNQIAPTGTVPTKGPTAGNYPGYNTTGNGGSKGGGRGTGTTTVTPHPKSGGGSNAGAIAGGALAGAALGIGLFKALHHPHAENSGQTVQRLGVSVRYPEDWKINPRLSLQEDPINFNNFNSSYLEGGIIPMGGADIDIAYFPGVNGPVPELVSGELADADEKQIDEHTYKIGGRKGTRVFYTDVYTRGFAYKNVAVYVPHEDGLYKFFLTYHQGDPNENAFNEDFEHILKSVRFER